MTQRGNDHFQVTSQPYRVEHDNMCKKKIKKEKRKQIIWSTVNFVLMASIYHYNV